MPTISGNVYFDATRSNTATVGTNNVPVVLQNTTTGVGLVVLTNSSGSFTFNNVPNGSYRLVEAWGTLGGVVTPGDFNTAAVITQPTPKDPPYTAVTSPPANTNDIDSMSPNTLFLNVTANVSGLIFRDAPITLSPVTINDVTDVGSNLITAANAGNWGALPAGTAINSFANPEPYPGVVPGFTYTNAVPTTDGQYTVTNISSLWGTIYADHTTGDETGRMQVVNGANPGNLFFTNRVNVIANKYYRFSTWMMNITGGAQPQLGFRIRTTGGTTIFQYIPSSVQQTTPRTWLEIATFFNSQNNTQLDVQFFSNGPSAAGNDYAIDDIFLTQVTLNNLLVTSQKLVDKNYADVGERLKYTVLIRNTGVSTVSNLIFKDTIPSGTSFVSNTLTLNGSTQAGANPTPPTGYTIGSPYVPLSPGATITLTFDVLVNTIPTINPINNSAVMDYAFAPIVGGVTVANSHLTNNVLTTVSTAQITTTKIRDLAFVGLGDIITYTIPMNNIGNTIANNVVFTDTIPNGTTLITDSVFINGTQQTGANPTPPTGVSVGNIGPNTITTLSFKVKVTALPVPNPISNSGTIRYNYTTDPSIPNGKSASVNTNSVTSQFNGAIITNTKTANKSYANVGDLITYTITIANTGNVSANTITFTDTIPNGTTFINGTVKINGTTQASFNPNPPGFVIPTPASPINPNAIITVTYDVRVSTIPNPNPIQNSSTTTATFTVDPGTTPVRTSVISTNSNVVNTTVNNVNLNNISKGVDKTFSSVGDILTYIITIPNTGSTTANNVVFSDTIPNGTLFIINSVYVNGTQQTGQVVAPPTGITLPNIGANAFVTLSFQVRVTSFPTPNPIPNSGTVRSSYNVDPTTTTTTTASGNSNFVYTQVNTATLTSTKSLTPSNILVGDTIIYTIVLRNLGNTTANNVKFIDTIPNGTTFAPGTFKINGTTISGADPSPPTGVTIPSIVAGGSQTITFSVVVSTIPSPNPTPNSSTATFDYVLNTITGGTIPSSSNSNIVTAYVNPDSNPLKIVDKQSTTVGDTLKYTIVWRNQISVDEGNVTLVDTIPSGTTFVPGSISITGGTQTGTTITPPNGLNVGTVPVGGVVTVTFNVVITSTIPTPNPIPNSVTAGYEFINDPTLGTKQHDTALSNTVTTQVNLATISSASKSVDKDFAKVGDVLEYTITFNNTGNVTANNIVLIDTIPNGCSFVINSVNVNNVNQPGLVVAPPTGLSVGTLAAGDTTTVKFKVTVVTIPIPNPIPNTASVGYNFQVDPAQGINKGAQINTNTVNTRVNFADISSPVKTVNKAYANIGDTLIYTIVLRNTGNVTATNIVFIDTIPNDTTLVPNTFKQDSTNISGSPNPPGVTLPNSLSPGSTTTITFNVTVNTIPSPNPIPNTASEYYSYIVDPTLNTTAIGSGNTNTVLTTVNNASLGNMYKSVDKLFATCGDILTYTINIPNSGNVTAFNVVLRDTIPSGTSLVANSVTVNSVTQPAGTTPQTGITIGTIPAGVTATVTFQVKVNC